MTIPAAYTEAALAIFMHSQIGDFPAMFGWVTPTVNAGAYQEAVNDCLIEYGVSEIAQATNIKKLRALATVAAWKKVLRQLPTYYQFQADGSTFNRQQMFEMARQSLAVAEIGASVYSSDYQIASGSVSWANDPYRYPLDADEE